MADFIFLLDEDNTLRELTEAHYLTEANLQQLLADFPQLMAGKQLNEASPRRWLLVKRELGIPDGQDSANRWSIDHLFLDQDGIPTLVEVKRSTDTRIRREVVGQLLDYASNATVYWTLESIMSSFQATCEQRSVDANQTLEEFLGEDAGESYVPESDKFWQTVETNLRAGKIRMLIVADVIPPELQRIIEFLNEQMDPAEFLGISIKQYRAEGLRTLVPRVIGLTSAAERKKSVGKQRASSGNDWTDEDFFTELAKRSPQAVDPARHILAHFRDKHGLRIWHSPAGYPAIIPVMDEPVNQTLFRMTSRNWIEIYFQYYNAAPFDQLEKRRELMERLNQIDGVKITEERLNRRPSFALSELAKPGNLAMFLGVFDWFLGEVKRTN